MGIMALFSNPNCLFLLRKEYNKTAGLQTLWKAGAGGLTGYGRIKGESAMVTSSQTSEA